MHKFSWNPCKDGPCSCGGNRDHGSYTSSLCCLADYPQIQPLETSIYCITAPWAESPGVTYLGISGLSSLLLSGWAASHPKSHLGKDPLSGPPGGLAGFRSSQARRFSSSLAVAQKPLRSLPLESLHRAAPNMAVASPRVRE